MSLVPLCIIPFVFNGSFCARGIFVAVSPAERGIAAGPAEDVATWHRMGGARQSSGNPQRPRQASHIVRNSKAKRSFGNRHARAAGVGARWQGTG